MLAEEWLLRGEAPCEVGTPLFETVDFERLGGGAVWFPAGTAASASKCSGRFGAGRQRLE